MNRETQYSFAALPETEIGRSKFNRSFNHATTFNNGDLVPIFCDHVMPGDTVNLSASSVIRMLTPLTPVMDSLYADIFFFYVPYRLIWANFKYFLGENQQPWTQTTDYRFPSILIGNATSADTSKKVEVGSLANYLGIPLGLGVNINQKSAIKINHLPFRAYCQIYNDWFKSETTEKNLYVPTSDTQEMLWSKTYTDSLAFTSSNYPKRCSSGGSCAKVNREFDYFSSCLPEPQKGPTVFLPLNGTASIKTQSFKPSGQTNYYGRDSDDIYVSLASTDPIGDNPHDYGSTASDFAVDAAYGKLVTDLSTATGATINAIRQAFAIQKFYERSARYGTRYGEVIQGHFNTTNPDIMIGRSEYLGGRRFPISINQVVAQGNTQDGIPLGDTGGYSVTSDASEDIFTKSFTEWGIVMGLICTRTHRSYQQGINRFWFMDKLTDMYWPEFANIGEQAVLEKEIYAQDGDYIEENETVFGYQEAWAHYRYSPDMITGELSSTYTNSLDIWHYGDFYESAPTLNYKWMEEPIDNVQRTLAYQEGHQFKGDFYFKATWTRPMPLYSVPGLVDHH